VEPFGFACRNALRPSTGPLDDVSPPKVDSRDLARRVAEIEAIEGSATNLAHTDMADSGITQR